jgi:hypothetical protein
MGLPDLPATLRGREDKADQQKDDPGGPMNVSEFFIYLLDSDATCDLALQLGTVYDLRVGADDDERELVSA